MKLPLSIVSIEDHPSYIGVEDAEGYLVVSATLKEHGEHIVTAVNAYPDLAESNLARHQADARVDHLVRALHVIRSQSTGPDWTAEQALAFIKDFVGETLTKPMP